MSSMPARVLIATGYLVAISLLTACSDQPAPADVQTVQSPPPMDTLVTAEWLNQHIGDPDLVVLDCTVVMDQDETGNLIALNGRTRYDAGHIPTAGFADLMEDLSDGDSSLEFAMPTPDAFAAAMSALGVGDDSRVVLYSADNPAWAARVWWMLRWIGFDNAALLDGGLGAWTAAGFPLSTEPASRPAQTLTVRLRPELVADRDEVMAAIGDSGVTIVDALPEPHYAGDMALYDRPGHIASAVNVPVTSLVGDDGRYLPLEELSALVQVDRGGRVITYCGGGIAASLDAFVLTRLGYPDVAVYTNSLQEWAADPDNPMESDWDSGQAEK